MRGFWENASEAAAGSGDFDVLLTDKSDKSFPSPGGRGGGGGNFCGSKHQT